MEEFEFSDKCPVCTDGTAIFMLFPELAKAAAAAVQFDEDEGAWKVLRCMVPEGWPQNSAAAELLAIIISVPHRKKSGKTEVVTDCMAILVEYQRLLKQYTWQRSCFRHGDLHRASRDSAVSTSESVALTKSRSQSTMAPECN